MQKLKLKFWRVENVVLMKVLEQDKSLRGAGMIYDGDLAIKSAGSPTICGEMLYIRGNGKEHDDHIAIDRFGTPSEAKSYIQKALRTVSAYNKSISAEPVTENDIETYIAE